MRSKSFWLTLLAALSLVASPTSARAAITPEGEVSPSDPATWDYYSTDAYIGNAASGTLTVDGGSRISSHLGYIGYGSGATGVVNISGSNSLWKTYGVCVGCSGGGTLSLANGGCLLMQANSETSSSYIGYSPGSSGLVSVDGPGSTLTNEFDLYVGNSGSGTISITNGGSISMLFIPTAATSISDTAPDPRAWPRWMGPVRNGLAMAYSVLVGRAMECSRLPTAPASTPRKPGSA